MTRLRAPRATALLAAAGVLGAGVIVVAPGSGSTYGLWHDEARLSTGTLVAFDSDWETLTVDSQDRALTRTILNAWCDRFPAGWIGRQMRGLFLDAGLADVETHPKTLVCTDLEVTDRVFSLFATADGLVSAGTIDRDDADRWKRELRGADAAGRFLTTSTGFLVSGTR